MPTSPHAERSLLDRFLSPELALDLGTRVTAGGWTLEDLTRSGRALPESSVGVYAGDADSYEVFAPLLEPMLEVLHAPGPPPASEALGHLDPAGGHIVSTRVRVARNLAGARFTPAMTGDDRAEVERRVAPILARLDGDIEGQYRPLRTIDSGLAGELDALHLLPHDDDRFMRVAGILDDWPQGRGVFVSAERTFAVWVNEEDHLRLMSLERGGDLARVAGRLERALAVLEGGLDFARSPRWGFLATCPTNVGEGMRASVHVRLPRLGRSPERLRALAADLGLAVRGTRGEHTDVEDAVFDLSVKRRVGLDRPAHLLRLQRGVTAVLEAEAGPP